MVCGHFVVHGRVDMGVRFDGLAHFIEVVVSSQILYTLRVVLCYGRRRVIVLYLSPEAVTRLKSQVGSSVHWTRFEEVFQHQHFLIIIMRSIP